MSTSRIPPAPTGVRHVNGATGEVTPCKVMYAGLSDDGIAEFEIITPIQYDLRRGDRINIAVLPACTAISFSTKGPS